MERSKRINHEVDFDKDEQVKHPIIQKHRDLLELLADERIFCVMYDETNHFFLLECCDEYYAYDLNQEDCLELSEMFKELAEAIQ